MSPTVQVGTILIEEQPLMSRFSQKSEPHSGKRSLVKVLEGFARLRTLKKVACNPTGRSFIAP